MKDETDAVLTELVREAERLGLYDLEIKQCSCGRAPPCRHLDDPDHPPLEGQ